jgi:hypothetical protein
MREMLTFRRDVRFHDEVIGRLGLVPGRKQYGAPDGCELRAGRPVCS